MNDTTYVSFLLRKDKGLMERHLTAESVSRTIAIEMEGNDPDIISMVTIIVSWNVQWDWEDITVHASSFTHSLELTDTCGQVVHYLFSIITPFVVVRK